VPAGLILAAKDINAPLSGGLSPLLQQHGHISFLLEPALPRPVPFVLFGAARVLRAGRARCPAGRRSDGRGTQRLPTRYNQPQQQEEGPARGTAAAVTLSRGQQDSTSRYSSRKRLEESRDFPGRSGQAA